MELSEKDWKRIANQIYKRVLEKIETDHTTHTDLSMENGNSNIKQSGNSFVYIDNSSLVYAALLLCYSLGDEERKAEIQPVLKKIERLMEENQRFLHTYYTKLAKD